MLRKQKEQHSEFKKYVKQRMRKGNPIKAEKLQDRNHCITPKFLILRVCRGRPNKGEK